MCCLATGEAHRCDQLLVIFVFSSVGRGDDPDQCDSNEWNEAETTREEKKNGCRENMEIRPSRGRREDDEEGGVRWRLPSSEGGLRDTKSCESQGDGPSSFHPPPPDTPISPNCFSAGLIKITQQPVM